MKSASEVHPDTIFNLGLIEGPIAAIPSLFAIFFYAKYKITKGRYEEIKSALAERRQAA